MLLPALQPAFQALLRSQDCSCAQVCSCGVVVVSGRKKRGLRMPAVLLKLAGVRISGVEQEFMLLPAGVLPSTASCPDSKAEPPALLAPTLPPRRAWH